MWTKALFFILIGVWGLIGCSSSDSNNNTGSENGAVATDNVVISSYTSSPEVDIPASIFPSLGNVEAKIRLDVFFDPWCPPCRAFDAEVRKFLEQDKYQKQVVVYFHLFPLINHFPQDREASLLHLEMAKRNLFLEFRKAVVDNNVSNYDEMLDLAQKMAKASFSLQDLEKRNANLLKAQQDVDQKLKLSHTPTIFINKKEITTTPSLEELSAGVDELIKELA